MSHLLRSENEVYTYLMDMSTAFDAVQHSHLFRKLIQQGLPAVTGLYILKYIKMDDTNFKIGHNFDIFTQTLDLST